MDTVLSVGVKRFLTKSGHVREYVQSAHLGDCKRPNDVRNFDRGRRLRRARCCHDAKECYTLTTSLQNENHDGVCSHHSIIGKFASPNATVANDPLDTLVICQLGPIALV